MAHIKMLMFISAVLINAIVAQQPASMVANWLARESSAYAKDQLIKNNEQVALGCEEEKVTIKCGNRFTRMEIVKTFYGRDDTVTCPNPILDTKTICEEPANDVAKKVLDLCHGENKCKVPVNVDFLGHEGQEICPGVRKYLRIVYKCTQHPKIREECPKNCSTSCWPLCKENCCNPPPPTPPPTPPPKTAPPTPPPPPPPTAQKQQLQQQQQSNPSKLHLPSLLPLPQVSASQETRPNQQQEWQVQSQPQQEAFYKQQPQAQERVANQQQTEVGPAQRLNSNSPKQIYPGTLGLQQRLPYEPINPAQTFSGKPVDDQGHYPSCPLPCSSSCAPLCLMGCCNPPKIPQVTALPPLPAAQIPKGFACPSPCSSNCLPACSVSCCKQSLQQATQQRVPGLPNQASFVQTANSNPAGYNVEKAAWNYRSKIWKQRMEITAKQQHAARQKNEARRAMIARQQFAASRRQSYPGYMIQQRQQRRYVKDTMPYNQYGYNNAIRSIYG